MGVSLALCSLSLSLSLCFTRLLVVMLDCMPHTLSHTHIDMRIGKVLHGIDVLNETQSEQLRH